MKQFIFNDDFKDFLSALNRHNVEYLIVSGYAVILHGHARNMGDLDLWVRRTEENYKRLSAAFLTFGMPVFDMTLENFLNSERFDVFTFGVPPVCIEILTALKGLEFEEAWKERKAEIIDGIQAEILGIAALRKAKESAGRAKDKDDLENLPKG